MTATFEIRSRSRANDISLIALSDLSAAASRSQRGAPAATAASRARASA